MLTMRARRFLKKIEMKLTVNRNKTIGFDKSNVECYDCHKRGHFTNECRDLRNQDNKHKESSRRSVPIETDNFTALVSCDGLDGYDWSDQGEERHNYALMVFSSSSSDSKRVNNQNFAKNTHPCAKKNIVPRDVLMKSGLISINTARQVNAAHLKTTVNAARSVSYLSKIAHSTVKRPIHKNTTFKNNNINQRVNTARPKGVVNAVKGNNINVVKASACYVWKPKNKVLDHVSKHNSTLITLKNLIILMHKADPSHSGLLLMTKLSIQLHAKVDGKRIIVTESFVKRDLRLADKEDKVVHKELGDRLVNAATTASSLEEEQDYGSEEVYVTEQEFVKDINKNVVEEVVNATQDSTATTTITTKEITLAQALKALKTSKPKVNGIFIQDKKSQIMLLRIRTRSAGRPAVESLGGGTGVWVGRGGRGRRHKEDNDVRVDDLNGQGNDQELLIRHIGSGCSYKEFLSCNPKEYDGKGGAVVLIQWIEKMENVQDMSGCSIDQKNHAMVEAGHAAYTDRFHELARLVPHLVTLESMKIKRYVYGLALQIHRMVAGTEPKTMQKAVQIFGALIDVAVRNGSIKKVKKRGIVGEPCKDKNGMGDNKRTRTGKRKCERLA
nr:reverse transcriptase domain-containing protein [Tanacetum cinerariifolium]